MVIDLREVDFIETESRRIVYHIGNDKYYQVTTKTELEELLVEQGFDALDRPYLVNMQRIRSYNKDYGKVYFVEHPTSNDKFVTVAKVKEEPVKRFIDYFIRENRDLSHEMKNEKTANWQKRLATFSKGLLK